MKTIDFSMVLGNFQKINVFEKSMQKVQFWVHFGMPKPLKIDRKSCLKLMLVSTPFFLRFFCFLTILARFGEAPGGPKIGEIAKKTLSVRVSSAFGLSVRVWKRL